MAFMRNQYVLLSLFALIGVIIGYNNIKYITILQSKIDPDKRGRVLGIMGTVSSALAPLGMALSGILADLLDKNIPLIFFMTALIFLLITIALFFHKEYMKFLEYDDKMESCYDVQ